MTKSILVLHTAHFLLSDAKHLSAQFWRPMLPALSLHALSTLAVFTCRLHYPHNPYDVLYTLFPLPAQSVPPQMTITRSFITRALSHPVTREKYTWGKCPTRDLSGVRTFGSIASVLYRPIWGVLHCKSDAKNQGLHKLVGVRHNDVIVV